MFIQFTQLFNSVKLIMENWRRYIKEELDPFPPETPEEKALRRVRDRDRAKKAAAEMDALMAADRKHRRDAEAYTQSLPPEILEFFEKERRRIIQDYSSGRGALNMQNHLLGFFQSRQEDLEASLEYMEGWAVSEPVAGVKQKLNNYRKIYESFKDGTAYKKYFKDVILQGLSDVEATYYDTMEQFATALETDPKHASGTHAFYVHRDEAIGFSPKMSRSEDFQSRKSRESITHELEHAVSHFFMDAAIKLLRMGLDLGPASARQRIKKGISTLADAQSEKLGAVLDLKQGTSTALSPYRERPEEQRAFIKSWTSTFKEDIKPEAIKALCELLDWRDRRGGPRWTGVPAHRREEVEGRWLSEFEKTAEIFPELAALLSEFESDTGNWMLLNHLNCKDAVATAKALNTLARAQTRKTSIPAE